MSSRGIHWRALTTFDLPAVADMAAVVHPEFFEQPSIFAERQRLYPDGARLLEFDGRPAYYVLSHPCQPALPGKARFGVVEAPEPAKKLASYDDAARFMIKPLG